MLNFYCSKKQQQQPEHLNTSDRIWRGW